MATCCVTRQNSLHWHSYAFGSMQTSVQRRPSQLRLTATTFDSPSNSAPYTDIVHSLSAPSKGQVLRPTFTLRSTHSHFNAAPKKKITPSKLSTTLCYEVWCDGAGGVTKKSCPYLHEIIFFLCLYSAVVVVVGSFLVVVSFLVVCVCGGGGGGGGGGAYPFIATTWHHSISLLYTHTHTLSSLSPSPSSSPQAPCSAQRPSAR